MAAGTENTVNEIYQGLRAFRGSITELAQKCNCTREWVRLVLKGVYVDNGLLEKAVELLLEKTTNQNANLQNLQEKIEQVRAAQI